MKDFITVAVTKERKETLQFIFLFLEVPPSYSFTKGIVLLIRAFSYGKKKEIKLLLSLEQLNSRFSRCLAHLAEE